MAVSPALLQLFDPFDGLAQDQLDHMAGLARVGRFPKGSFLTKRGKDVELVCFLVAGNVDLVDANFESESIDCEGERRTYPLVARSPSPVSAMAKSDVELLVIDMDAYNLACTWKEDSGMKLPRAASTDSNDDGTDWMVCLLDSPLFSQVPPAQIQQLFTRFEAVEVEAEAAIVREGAPGDYFYVIESGTAEVHSRFSGTIARLSAGNFFGEEALVGETLRNASVTMKSAGVVMRLSKEDFKALLMAPLIRFLDGDQLHEQIEQGISIQILDVRLPLEHRKLHVKNSQNIPLSVLRGKLNELDHNRIYVVADDGGKRSEVAAHLLCQAGFTTYILQNAYLQYPLDKLA